MHADPNANQTRQEDGRWHGHTVLLAASRGGHIEIVQLLLEKGAHMHTRLESDRVITRALNSMPDFVVQLALVEKTCSDACLVCSAMNGEELLRRQIRTSEKCLRIVRVELAAKRESTRSRTVAEKKIKFVRPDGKALTEWGLDLSVGAALCNDTPQTDYDDYYNVAHFG